MRNRYFSLALFALALPFSAMAGNGKIYHKGWIDFNKNGRMDVFEDPKADVEARVKDLLSQMTMEEKTCQLATLYGSGKVLQDGLPTPEWKNRVWKDGIANIDEEHTGYNDDKWGLNFPLTTHVDALHKIQRWFVEETRLGIPVDWTNEGIRGLAQRGATFFPAQCGQGATWDRDLISQIADVEGEEADVLGFTNVYSPILDIAQDPRWGRCVESYGEDPYLVGELGLRMIKGLQAHRVVSTPKHFAVYSVPVGGRDGMTRTDPKVAPREMMTLNLEPFRKAFVEGHALGTMSSYNDWDGVPITGSHYFLTDLLRKRFGFRGYVVSDSQALEYLYFKHHVAKDYEDAAAMAVNAGMNVRTDFTKPEDYITPLRQAVRDGKISEETLNERVAEVLRVKFWEGLFDNPYRGDGKVAGNTVKSAEHEAVALRASRECLVLLKNEGNLLPLSKSLKRIAVIGPNADEKQQLTSRYGPWKANVITVVEGIRKEMPQAEVVYSKGCNIRDEHYPESEILDYPLSDKEQQMISEAVNTAKSADVAIMVLGGNNEIVGEGKSRTSLNLSGRQEDLLKAVVETGKTIVLVLMDGRASTVNYAQKYVPAILHAWQPGEFGGQAIAEALFGDYNPGGHLAVTFPKSVGQLPYAFPSKPYAKAKCDNHVNGALYPFGFGLSYTTFGYANLKISPESQSKTGEIHVSCDVTNTGNREGDEVVQLYLRDVVSSVTTYEKVLRGFERVSLKPGETRTVSFTLTPQDLAIWDKDMQFTVEPGDFNVMVGSSSEDIRLKGKFTIE